MTCRKTKNFIPVESKTGKYETSEKSENSETSKKFETFETSETFGTSEKSKFSEKSSNPENHRSSLRIGEISPENRPQERLIAYGPGALSNAELMAVILRTGTRQENIIQICQRLFSEYTLSSLSRANLSRLKNVHGIGDVKAAQICAVFELSRRLEMYSDAPKRKITSPQDVFDVVHSRLRGEKKEHFVVLYLDTKNQVIKDEIISIGSLNASIVHPREIFRQAVLEAAAAVILVHNHPSGDPRPSQEDIDMTERVCKAGNIVGIDVLDHVVVGESDFISMKQEGYMRCQTISFITHYHFDYPNYNDTPILLS